MEFGSRGEREQALNEASLRIYREIFEKVGMTSVHIGDVTIAPWELASLRHEIPNQETVPTELPDPKKRIELTEEAMDAALAIIKVATPFRAEADYAGECNRAAHIVQELLAQVGVRSVVAWGLYDVHRTAKHRENLEHTILEKYLPHSWVYESISGAIPVSTEHAKDDLLLVDPTRRQFEQVKPEITHLGDARYQLFAPKRDDHDFKKENSWLWNSVELNQWQAILRDVSQED